MSGSSTVAWNSGATAAAATAVLPDGPALSWIALPPGGPIRVLVPREQAAAGPRALRQLMGHTGLLRRLGAALGARAIQLGGDRLLRPRPQWEVAANRLLGHARRVSGDPDAVGVIRVNPNRPNRKPVIQLLTADAARTLAYVKIGWDELTAPLVRGETRTLRRLDPPSSLRVPAVLGADTGEVPALALSPVVHRSSDRRSGAPIDLATAALRVFGPDGFGTDEVVPLATCGVLTGARGQLQQLDVPYAAALLERVDTLCERHGALELASGRWHGDWNRANVAVRDDDVAAWDWERSTTGAPHGLDAAYTLLSEHTPARSLELLVASGLAVERSRALSGLALVVAATRHAEAMARGVASRATRALQVLDEALGT